MWNRILKDEKGYFVFGPLWFVVLVMIIAFIASLLKNNNTKNNVTEQVDDYEKVRQRNKPLNITCHSCGKSNPKSAKFCNKCGISLNDVHGIFCPECGTENSKKAHFCSECGFKFG